jgi:ATPase subunit of ABC transporter with duplicated ATPase domains
VEDVRAYAGSKLILDGVTWRVGPGDRVGLVGANGAGKTTLLRLLTGSLAPRAGRVDVGATVRAAMLSQEPTELPLDLRVLEAVDQVASRVRLGDRELSAAQLAEVFGFADDRGSAARRGSLWTPVADLSGGERRRLQLLRLLAGEPNVLLLDEPTNDLDTDTLAALEDLLDTWPGTLVVASHDRYLIERVTDAVYALPGDGTLRHLPGGVDEYLGLVTAAPGDTAVPAPAAATGGPSASELREARKELARLERLVARLAERETRLEQELAIHATDYAKVTELDDELRRVRAERGQAEDAWLTLAERLPAG